MQRLPRSGRSEPVPTGVRAWRSLAANHRAPALVRQQDRGLMRVGHEPSHRGLHVLPPAAGIIVDDDEPARARARIEEVQRRCYRLAEIAIDVNKSELLARLDCGRGVRKPAVAIDDFLIRPDERLHRFERGILKGLTGSCWFSAFTSRLSKPSKVSNR